MSVRSVGNRYVGHAKFALGLARWSSGAFVATWAFHGINVRPQGEQGLFESINKDARDALACLAVVPAFIPLAAVLISAFVVYSGFYNAAREVFVGKGNEYRIDFRRGVEVNLRMRQLPLWWRNWMRWGWWWVAIVTGGLTVLLAGWALRSDWPSWLAWAVCAVTALTLLKLERRITVARYEEHATDRVPEPAVIEERERQWRQARPDDRTGMPLLFAYSGLSADELRARFLQFGSTGVLGFTSKLLQLVVIVLTYSLLPAPKVDRFGAEGLVGCIFANLHNLAGVAEENLGLTIAAAVVLWLVLPLSILEAHRRFMAEHRFPLPVMLEVLRRESGFAQIMWPVTIVMTGVMGVLLALVLWASAVVAHQWDSPLAGAVVLVVPMLVVLRFLVSGRRRG